MTQDEIDFIDAMKATAPSAGDLVETLIKQGFTVQHAAFYLEEAAKVARGWCVGRFG